MTGVKIEDIGLQDYVEEDPVNYPTQEEIDTFYGQEEQYEDEAYASEYPTPYELANYNRNMCDAFNTKYAE
jgi:hypothetical protein